LGNVNHDDFAGLALSKHRTEFAALKTKVPAHCRSCRFFGLCQADCTRFRMFPGRDADQVSFLCPGFHDFLEYTEQRFAKLRDDILRRRQSVPATARSSQVNAISGYPRNEPCPCGSGEKYKKCCGKGQP
jgi:sulfatase maturation enzyme AslB (radical SAM superfamily)